jgi:hypothetical protein
MANNTNIWLYLAEFFLVRSSEDKNFRENQNMYFMFKDFFFFCGNPRLYEIKWKNILQPGRPQITT